MFHFIFAKFLALICGSRLFLKRARGAWAFRLLRWENVLLQDLHSKGFSPVWILSCLFSLLSSENFLLQDLHWNGFSPVCILSWILRYQDCWNALLHVLHSYGLSPVWVFHELWGYQVVKTFSCRFCIQMVCNLYELFHVFGGFVIV